MAATDVLFRIYQYWEHQHTGKRLEGEIHEDGKCQACVSAPNAMTPVGQAGKRFVSTLALELDSIRGRKWNSERVIIFQMDILKRACLVSGPKNICA